MAWTLNGLTASLNIFLLMVLNRSKEGLLEEIKSLTRGFERFHTLNLESLGIILKLLAVCLNSLNPTQKFARSGKDAHQHRDWKPF